MAEDRYYLDGVRFVGKHTQIDIDETFQIFITIASSLINQGILTENCCHKALQNEANAITNNDVTRSEDIDAVSSHTHPALGLMTNDSDQFGLWTR